MHGRIPNGSEHGWRHDIGDYGRTVKALLAAGAWVAELKNDFDAREEALATLRRYSG
jgi:hypothetical protein